MRGAVKNIDPGSHIHFMGICGTAMASLAALLKERGFRITGSDQNVYPPMSTFLEEKGIAIQKGYQGKNLEPAPDYVVVGNVISKHFPEAQALLKSDIPYGSLPETLGDFVIEDRHAVVVCGTHGKTTTTSLASWVADQAHLQPGFLIGGIAKNFSTSYRNPKGSWFVIEGDEYDSAFFSKVPKFTYYKPKTAILTSVEFDHADIYPNMDGIFAAFSQLMTTLDPSGVLIFNGEDKNILKLLPEYSGEKVSYGWASSQWTLDHLKVTREGLRFEVFHKGKKEDAIHLPMFGKYNGLNALAVYVLARVHGWSVDLPSVFAKFQGIKRRQELIGEPGGVQVIEDFAHHPTAVKGTLESFRQREGAQKVVGVFEPRSATSRRNYFQEEYVEALALADRVFICKPYDAEALGDLAMDTDKLCKDLQGRNCKATTFESVDEILESVAQYVEPGDTIVVMSNGGFQGIYNKLLQVLEKR